MHLAPLIKDLAIILGVAGIMSLLFQKIRQPVVLGYIIAGVIVGPYTPPVQLVKDIPSIQTWADLGVIFLMFSLGLEFSFRKLGRVGASAGITAGTEVLFFLPVGYIVGKLFGWSSMDSIFLGAMLSISSTTIIIKALDELKLKTHHFAELIFAVLIVEDLIAILLLVALSTVATTQTVSVLALLTAGLKLILVVGGWFITGYFIVPRFMKYVEKVASNEILTIVSLGLCLALVVFATHFHYSTALGAFIMGSILAETPILHRIEKRMESLRDLFGAIFFVSIGMLIDPKILFEHLGIVLTLCVVTIVGKIISTSLGSLLSGQTFRNSLQVGFGLAQIGEFSFIIAGLGYSLKATSEFLYPIAVAVSLVTTFTTPYLIRLSGPIAVAIEQRLPLNLRTLLIRYAIWSEQRRAGSGKRDDGLPYLFQWFINGLIITILFAISEELLLPYLIQRGNTLGAWAYVIAWFAAALISAPFIWGMLSSVAKYARSRAHDRNPVNIIIVLLSWLFTLIWIGALSAEFFPGRYVALFTTIILLSVFWLFYRRLEKYYRWYEKEFLSIFENHEATKTSADMLSHLAPWDVHLVTIEVHPNAPIIKKRLMDAALRTRCGVNVVAIQRGVNTIVAPKPDEMILPKDELIVLGTDAQVDSLRRELEMPPEFENHTKQASDYQLKQARLSDQSPFTGQTIRESGIREKFHAMVVGIEREGKRNINPDSSFKLIPGDTLWVVGEKSNLNQLISLLKNIPLIEQKR
jgi:CPA2 family monovalent cation:H+ antiporter-2